jgi:hypothetical protein
VSPVESSALDIETVRSESFVGALREAGEGLDGWRGDGEVESEDGAHDCGC